jgi:26S proteasome regulatory subunit N12
VLASVRQGDDAGFERNFAQLRPFYTDARAALPPSPQEPALAALRLLALLAHNRIAEFHTAVELAPEVVLSSPEAAQVLQLEGWLMEGAYNKVLAARASPASPYFAPLLDRLAGTVRDEVAGCAEAAYASLPEGEAARMLTLAPGAELGAYAAARGWAVAAGRVVFKPEGGGAAAPAVPALEIIDHCLTYAKELERII